MKRFHAEVSKDPVAIVGDWVNGVRDVSFMMPVNVPVVMKKMIGANVLQCTKFLVHILANGFGMAFLILLCLFT